MLTGWVCVYLYTDEVLKEFNFPFPSQHDHMLPFPSSIGGLLLYNMPYLGHVTNVSAHPRPREPYVNAARFVCVQEREIELVSLSERSSRNEKIYLDSGQMHSGGWGMKRPRGKMGGGGSHDANKLSMI